MGGGTKKLSPDAAIRIAHVQERPKNAYMESTVISRRHEGFISRRRNGKKVRKVSKVRKFRH